MGYNDVMPSDYLTLKALADELNTMLVDGRVDKITQPSALDIVLSIRAGGANRQLILSANPSMPRLHLTNTHRTSPPTAPSFCMHLRKYLTSAHVDSVTMLGEDRIAEIRLSAKTELRDNAVYSLIIELMGRYSNILLVRGGIISDCIKHISIDESSEYRMMMPGIPYSTPTKGDKLAIHDIEGISQRLLGTANDNLPRTLFDNISGIAYQTACEILHDVTIPTTGLADEQTAISAARAVQVFADRASSRCAPCVSLDSKGLATDFYIYPYAALNGNFLNFSSMNSACDFYYSQRSGAVAFSGHVSRLRSVVDRQIKKLEKKLSLVTNKLHDAEDAEKMKAFGDAIINCIYMIKRGESVQHLINYSESGAEDIAVPYDERLSPSKNAEKYYTRYNKLKRTRISNEAQYAEVTEHIDYLKSIIFSLDNARCENDLRDIEQELISLELLRDPNAKSKKKQKVAYTPAEWERHECEGFTILVGKNNLQNDKLTFSVASQSDLWLHTKNYHSAHVIIVTCGETVPDSVLLFAAKLCADRSDARGTRNIPVDYTEKRYVKRHPTGRSGLVIYTNFKTINV